MNITVLKAKYQLAKMNHNSLNTEKTAEDLKATKAAYEAALAAEDEQKPEGEQTTNEGDPGSGVKTVTPPPAPKPKTTPAKPKAKSPKAAKVAELPTDQKKTE